MSAQQIITQHLDIWTAAHKTRSSAGRGSSNKLDLYGIKKLRELILELAVSGKLVPQDPNDEPASKLIGRLIEKKRQLINTGKIKKDLQLESVIEDDTAYDFDLPIGWSRQKLGNLFEIQRGSSPRPKGDRRYFSETETTNHWIKISDISAYTIDNKLTGTDEFLTNEGTIHSRLVTPLDIIVAVSGSVGKACKLAISGYIYDGLMAIKNIEDETLRDYLFLQFKVVEQELLSQATGSAWKNINTELANNMIMALPPLAEQHRIVAKVDELMAFCDQLEQTQSDNIAAHAQLVEALLASLTNSADHNELQTNWQRVAAHFDTLFTTEHSIDQLKQTILQLAVMGKLVPQNPNDEPASELLKKIAAEKAQLIKEGKIKKEKPLPEITDEEKPFELPSNWYWVRLGVALKKITDGTHHSPTNTESGEYLYISAKNIKNEGVQLSNATYVTADVHAEIYSRCDPEYGDILYIKDGATTGIVTINNLNEPFSMLSSVALLKCPKNLLNRYLLVALRSPFFYQEMRAGMTGVAITRVTLKNLNEAFIGLPPLDEQHRIVTKVDELMALCDALKTNLQNAQTTQLALADALVEQAVG